MSDLKAHPAAEVFPMLPADELKSLAEDIAANGLNEPIITYKGLILDGRNRYAACRMAKVSPVFREYKGDSPTAYAVSSNIRRRHLTPSQKGMLASDLKVMFEAEAREKYKATVGRPKTIVGKNANDSLDTPASQPAAPNPPEKEKPAPVHARATAAKAVGVSDGQVNLADQVKNKDPELAKKVREGKTTLSAAKKAIAEKERQEQLAAAQKSLTEEKRINLESVCDLRVCSCAELFASGIKPDVVITDPPYPREFLPTFTELAEGCARAGVRMVAVMSGQSYLPEVMLRLCEHLEYYWTMAYLTPGGQSVQLWDRKVNTFWKPILLFGSQDKWTGDVCNSKTNDNDKKFHHWGQSESGMADLIDRVSKPGDLVCDPFLGGGTTAVVALKMGRRFVGCDIEKEFVEKTRTRVEAEDV